MTFYSVSNPFMQVFNLQGTGLNDGDVYFGVAGQDPITNPKTVYWDIGGTDVAAQPIPTTGGYLYRSGTPAEIYLDSEYSIKVLDKNGGLVYYQANVFDPVFAALARLDTLAAAGGAGEIGYDVTNTYPAGTVGKRLQAFVDVTDAPYNAKADGATDDTAAVQAAIDSGALTIILPGQCVVSSLVVNRPVDTETSYLTFIGTNGGGFKMTAPGTLFTSTLTGTPTGSPQSEKVAFENIQFEASNAADACYIMSKNFLRIRFNDCIFHKIKVGLFEKGTDTSAYAQQYTFSGGHAAGWQGDFFKAFQGYAVNMCNGFHLEAGANGFVFDGGVFDVGSVQCLFEGCTGSFWTIAGGYTATFVGNYTEGNGGPDYVLADVPNGGSTKGITFTGNCIKSSTANGANTAYWAVVLGASDIVSVGNTCYPGNYLDDTATPRGQITSNADLVTIPGDLNKSGIPISIIPSNQMTVATALAFAGTDAATATPITTTLAQFTTGPGGTTAGATLPAANFGSLGGICVVQNNSPDQYVIYPKAGDTLNNVTTAIKIPSGCEMTFRSTATGSWTTLRAPIPFQAQVSGGASLATLIAAFNQLTTDAIASGNMNAS